MSDSSGKDNSNEEVSSVAEPHHFYVNITLLNKNEMVASKIQEKTGTGIFGKVAGKVANAGVSDEKIIGKLSENLCQALPKTLGEMGITGTFEEVFSLHNFVVYKCNIGAIDKITLFRGAKGEDFANQFQTLLDTLSNLGIEKAAANIDSKMQSKVRLGMMEKLGSMLPQKMSEKGMEVACVVNGPEDQADFFFSHLRTLS